MAKLMITGVYSGTDNMPAPKHDNQLVRYPNKVEQTLFSPRPFLRIMVTCVPQPQKSAAPFGSSDQPFAFPCRMIATPQRMPNNLACLQKNLAAKR